MLVNIEADFELTCWKGKLSNQAGLHRCSLAFLFGPDASGKEQQLSGDRFGLDQKVAPLLDFRNMIPFVGEPYASFPLQYDGPANNFDLVVHILSDDALCPVNRPVSCSGTDYDFLTKTLGRLSEAMYPQVETTEIQPICGCCRLASNESRKELVKYARTAQHPSMILFGRANSRNWKSSKMPICHATATIGGNSVLPRLLRRTLRS